MSVNFKISQYPVLFIYVISQYLYYFIIIVISITITVVIINILIIIITITSIFVTFLVMVISYFRRPLEVLGNLVFQLCKGIANKLNLPISRFLVPTLVV